MTIAMRERDDAELIDNTRAGDSAAYAELYRRHYPAGRAAAQALTHNRSDTDDVTSEAFARVLRASQSGGGPDVLFRPYLVAAVRNVFYDSVRCNRESPSDHIDDEINRPLCDVETDGDTNAFASVALAALPARWRRVLWHIEVEGRSVAEIGEALGIAPSAVAALAYRAREGLRRAYLRAPH